MTGISTSRTAAFVATSLLLLNPAIAGSTHHHHHDRTTKTKQKHKSCKDRAGVHCGLIRDKGDCNKHNFAGEGFGETVCRVSCGTCEDVPNQISTDHQCYEFAKQQIHVNFSNSLPHHEDWVGIYPADADSNDLGTPVAWFWLCGNKRDKCATSVGMVTFPWLPAGTYKAIMSRNKDAMGPYASYGPYKSYAESETFEVARGGACALRRLGEDAPDEEAAPSLRGTQP